MSALGNKIQHELYCDIYQGLQKCSCDYDEAVAEHQGLYAEIAQLRAALDEARKHIGFLLRIIWRGEPNQAVLNAEIDEERIFQKLAKAKIWLEANPE